MHLPKTRWRAFGAHFGISLVIFIVLLLIIVFLWYPGALFSAAGGWQGIRIVIGVDLVLGPLLTLIIYNAAKPRHLLYLDLSIIATVQLLALAAGIYIVHNERPVVVAYAYNNFYSLKKSDFFDDFAGEPIDVSNIGGFNFMTPKIFHVELPDDEEEIGAILATHSIFGSRLEARTDLYLPFSDDGRDAEKIFRYNEYGTDLTDGDCVRVKLSSIYTSGEACFNVEKQRFSDFIPDEGE
ncbi:MAG: hypothetical protein MJA83_11670 [Gammaproteobacteria bacterium]|nr:hypothetical protein [Gammaproteobacteria bacterium]